MHSHCFAQYTRYNYTCPVCAKSLGDMSVYFQMIENLVEHDRANLPLPYKHRQQVSSWHDQEVWQSSLSYCSHHCDPWDCRCHFKHVMSCHTGWHTLYHLQHPTIVISALVLHCFAMQELLCNDCEERSSAPFHFVYHKCGHCASYNTRIL